MFRRESIPRTEFHCVSVQRQEQRLLATLSRFQGVKLKTPVGTPVTWHHNLLHGLRIPHPVKICQDIPGDPGISQDPQDNHLGPNSAGILCMIVIMNKFAIRGIQYLCEQKEVHTL